MTARETNTKIVPTHRTAIACPHCGGRLTTRTSRGLTPLYRYLELRCVDHDCAASFGGELAITHAIHPSRHPNPSVSLRTAPPRPRPANDRAALPANDQAPGTPPSAANDDEVPVGEAAL